MWECYVKQKNISSLINHAQYVEGDNLREQAKDNKMARTCNYECLNKNQIMQIALSLI